MLLGVHYNETKNGYSLTLCHIDTADHKALFWNENLVQYFHCVWSKEKSIR